MRNLLLTISYDGTNFHGWQVQPNAVTVQGEVNAALSRILNEEIKTNGCSRTDAGVHANEFCLNFSTSSSINVEKLCLGLNAILPESISVKSAEEKPEEFHARFDCQGKRYIYKILNTKTKNPFSRDFALHYPYNLDLELMNKACKCFIGTKDFSAFCASGATVEDKVRTIYSCKVYEENGYVVFSVVGDGFLYNMVRIMVGTLLYVAQGKIKLDDIPKIIGEKKREQAGITAKAHGLYLDKVFYNLGELKNSEE